MKKIYILNGTGTSGKGTFVNYMRQYMPSLYYSIAELPKEAANKLGWDGGKTEKDRKFLSDIVDLSTAYNDAPFKDVASLVTDFKKREDFSGYEVLFIDMRDPKDIARAVKEFGAETILMRKPDVRKIESNHADKNVENYEYDYIIENDGSLEQLDLMARFFAREMICWNEIRQEDKPLVLTCSIL